MKFEERMGDGTYDIPMENQKLQEMFKQTGLSFEEWLTRQGQILKKTTMTLVRCYHLGWIVKLENLLKQFNLMMKSLRWI